MALRSLDEQPLLLRGGIEYTGYPVIFDNYVIEQGKPTLPNDNRISLYEGLSELKKYPIRKKQKSLIDQILNKYVEQKDMPSEYKNDFRHRAGSYLMSDFLGDADKGHLWGNLKEIGDLTIGKENDSFIDSPNNYIGRNYYLESDIPRNKILDVIYDDVRNNTLFDIDYNETRLPAQNLWYGLNKLTHPIYKKFNK